MDQLGPLEVLVTQERQVQLVLMVQLDQLERTVTPARQVKEARMDQLELMVTLDRLAQMV
jgi:hypothetical protein